MALCSFVNISVAVIKNESKQVYHQNSTKIADKASWGKLPELICIPNNPKQIEKKKIIHQTLVMPKSATAHSK